MKKTASLTFLSATVVLLAVIFCASCSDNDEPKPFQEKQLAGAWADETLYLIFHTPPNSPTYTSRSLGYLGLTMYESVVHGNASRQSIGPQLNGTLLLPMPGGGKEYNWALALNAGQASMLKSLYPHATAENVERINALEKRMKDSIIANITDQGVIDRSIAYGREVANAIFEWSKTDGGHEGYTRNFDPEYVFPSGPGFWVPPVGGQSASLLPLHPYWGANRTFLAANSLLPIPQPHPYSTSSASEYYQQFKAVHDKAYSLTDEEKKIAAWWADDPTQTASPPGHSYNLATIAVEKSDADIFEASEIYAKVGMAVADAFICCWKCKYVYHAERPFGYIQKYIATSYIQFWPEPPFPAFSSGHATQSAAAAIAMESVLGENFGLTDDTYANRKADFLNIPYSSRTYASIWETAEECANSRFYGGIHTPQDNQEGQKQGIAIGENVAGLIWDR